MNKIIWIWWMNINFIILKPIFYIYIFSKTCIVFSFDQTLERHLNDDEFFLINYSTTKYCLTLHSIWTKFRIL